MRLIDIQTKLSALALAAILPLSITACGDDVTGSGDTEDDDSGTTTDGSTTDPTATTLTTTTNPTTEGSSSTSTTDPTDTDPSSSSTDPTVADSSSSGSSTDPSESSSSTGTPAECGDGVIEGDEECDGDEIGDATCPVVGEVACADDCTLDLTGCADSVLLCNTPAAALGVDQTVDAPLLDVIAIADDFFVTDVNVQVDVTHSWVGDVTALLVSPDVDAGSVLVNQPCNTDALADIDANFDDDGAALVCAAAPPTVAGDTAPLTELRDLIGINAVGDWTFAAWDNFSGADDGVLNEWCLELTLSADDPVSCGDDTAHYGEVCDGTDTNGQDCTTIEGDFVGGTLGCADDCSAFDTSMCVAPGCGNDITEPGTETCDGADLNDLTCDDFDGFTGAGLACLGDCSDYDTSGCTAVVCGDDIVNGPEECDNDNLDGITCDDLPGFMGAGLACADDCTFDTSACEIDPCGNGEIDDGEDCDGTNIGGTTCEDQGFVGGSLGCAADCTFEEAECSDDVLTYCSAPGTVIPTTAPPTQVTDVITVADTADIADLDVFVDITHTWTGDLEISVTDPSATTVQIRGADDVCNGNTDDIFAFFNDEAPGAADCAGTPAIEGNVTPFEPLSGFDGAPIMGDWTLTVDDTASGDGGSLNEWCLYITAAP